ncbi:MAG: glycosyl hydrolase [Geminicoccaceae bacterium]
MNSWNDMLIFYRGPVAKEFAPHRNGRVLAISTPLLTNESKGQFDACARGSFDWVWRQVATALTRNNVPDTIIRLGAEANGTWTPYSINGNYAGFKACFRRAVEVMRSVQPRLRFEWSMNRSVYSSKLNTLVTQAYPGNDVVDIIGLSFYDHWPAATSQSVWNTSFKPELDFWTRFARENGKKLAFGEWGLGDKRGGAFDNPLYITNMNAFFNANRDIIAYESYFNCSGSLGTSYLVYPERYNPRAAATYRNLW